MRDGISGISPTHRPAINIKRRPNTNKRRVRAPLNLDFTAGSALNPACTCAGVSGGDQEGDAGEKKISALVSELREEIPTPGSGRAINSQWVSPAVRHCISVSFQGLEQRAGGDIVGREVVGVGGLSGLVIFHE